MVIMTANICFRVLPRCKCHLLYTLRSTAYQKRRMNMYTGIATKVNGAAVKNHRVVDLRSDTLSKPTPEMRQAMFEAEVGDDVYGEDPTVKALEEKAAAVLGKEAGLFIPTGTMGNLIAIMTHCNQRGCEVIVGDMSHTFLFEQGGAAQIGGVQLCTIANEPDGTFNLQTLRSKVRSDNDHEPTTSLIIVENTHNYCGGKVLPMAWIDQLAELACNLHIPLHMDGARLFNAATCLGVPAARIVRDFASITFCLSKGLGAPVGSVLVGSTAFIRRCRRQRKALGGGMRQVGVLAAPGLVALEHMTLRLHEDHVRARSIASVIDKFGSKHVHVDLKNLHTNILMIHTDPNTVTAHDFCNRMAAVTEDEETKLGNDTIVVKINPKSDNCVRLVTYYEITDNDVHCICSKLQYILEEFDKM